MEFRDIHGNTLSLSAHDGEVSFTIVEKRGVGFTSAEARFRPDDTADKLPEVVRLVVVNAHDQRDARIRTAMGDLLGDTRNREELVDRLRDLVDARRLIVRTEADMTSPDED